MHDLTDPHKLRMGSPFLTWLSSLFFALALTAPSLAENDNLTEDTTSPRLIRSPGFLHQDTRKTVIHREGILELLEESDPRDYLEYVATGVLHLDDDEYNVLLQLNGRKARVSDYMYGLTSSRPNVVAAIDNYPNKEPSGEASPVHFVHGLLLEGWLFREYGRVSAPGYSHRGDNTIELILQLRNLRSLDLYGSTVSDAGVNRLVEGLEHLEALYLPHTTTSSGLKAAFLSKTISELSVYDCMQLRLGDLGDLENPGRIKTLDLRGIQSKSGDFTVLDRFVNLEVLDLRGNPVTDSDLAELTSIHSLRVLALTGSQVSAPSTWPASLRREIQHLDLRGCDLSEVPDWSMLFPKLRHLLLP